MTVTTQILGYVGLGLFVLGVAASTFLLGATPPVPRPELGSRGLKRHLGLQHGAFFGYFEPAMRLVAGWLSDLPLTRMRTVIDQKIHHAGDHLGLSADELIGLSLVTGATSGLFALFFCNMHGLPMAIVPVAVAISALMPWYRIKAIATERMAAINRALPSAVDLAALCMGAGLDFPGSLRQIVGTAPRRTAPIVEEFDRILQELELGHARNRALRTFAMRVPTTQVREFVSSVVQAEEKGNPLSEVLQTQARMQRMRRSVAIEELASKAALQLLGPMMIIFVCIVVLLVGPVIIRFSGGGF